MDETTIYEAAKAVEECESEIKLNQQRLSMIESGIRIEVKVDVTFEDKFKKASFTYWLTPAEVKRNLKRKINEKKHALPRLKSKLDDIVNKTQNRNRN